MSTPPSACTPMRRTTAALLAFSSFIPLTIGSGPGDSFQDQAGRGQGRGARSQDPEEKKEDRPGIPVSSVLINDHCATCHEEDDRGMMGRISYMRKSPEGWSMSIKRMVRLYDVVITPEEARQMVRYLSNEHGLARAEAERGLYESERRVHWSEQHHDQERLQACASCHSLGRILNQQRDADEWRQLKATHLAYFPVARQSIGSAFSSSNRRGGGQGGAAGANRGSLGDRVLAQLAEELPLITDEWKKWSVNRREVPLAGTWTITGHEVGRGDLLGEVSLTRVAEDDYETVWDFEFQNGDRVQRRGKGLLYAGYSWRGRSTDSAGTSWREVLLVDDEWRQMKGRLFTGAYDELGVEVQFHRHIGMSQVFAIRNRAIRVPATGHVLDVYGESFPENLRAEDFGLGAGITVTAVDRLSSNRVRLTVDAVAGDDAGERLLSIGANKGTRTILLYDKVDYLRITPLQGLSRIGGGMAPKQYERFEAIAVNRGPDDKPYTDDDYDISVVMDATWSLEEFPVWENDDDLLYVGQIDAGTGLFTPAIDGPNPVRKWSANNVGEVYVVANADVDGESFKARGHLVVTVPLYQRGNALEWEDQPDREVRRDR